MMILLEFLFSFFVEAPLPLHLIPACPCPVLARGVAPKSRWYTIRWHIGGTFFLEGASVLGELTEIVFESGYNRGVIVDGQESLLLQQGVPYDVDRVLVVQIGND